MEWGQVGNTRQGPGPYHPELPAALPRFVCKNNGVLFENQLLQIGVKSEFRQNLGVCEDKIVGLGSWKDLGLGSSWGGD